VHSIQGLQLEKCFELSPLNFKGKESAKKSLAFINYYNQKMDFPFNKVISSNNTVHYWFQKHINHVSVTFAFIFLPK